VLSNGSVPPATRKKPAQFTKVLSPSPDTFSRSCLVVIGRALMILSHNFDVKEGTFVSIAAEQVLTSTPTSATASTDVRFNFSSKIDSVRSC
jgi:hypothetical protein